MPIPDFQTLMRPILVLHEDGRERSATELRDAIAAEFGVTDAEREELLPSGRVPLFNNRIGWALTHLSKAGALDRPRRAYTRITSRGRDLLAEHPERVDMTALDRFPEYRTFRNLEGSEDEASARGDEPVVWMVRAGRGGVYAPAFIERSAAIVGWGRTGSIEGLSRESIADRVRGAFPDYSSTKLASAVGVLRRLSTTMSDGDLILTPEPATKTILFGRVVGPYAFLEDPIEMTADYQHVRPVRWFGRVDRNELSYGARNSLGSMLTLSQPGHAGELLQIASLHADDPAPAALAQQRTRRVEAEPRPQRVTIPANAAVRQRARLAEFNTNPVRLMRLLDNLHVGELALPDFQRSFVWAPGATRELLVSMMRAFPAGALLFLHGGGTSFKARPVEGAPELERAPHQLVLDGQQRLTSLYQALYGLGTSRFFLDIGALISGADVDDAVRVFTSSEAAPLETPEAQADALMMPLSVVRDSRASRWTDRVVELRTDADQAGLRTLLRDVEDAFVEPLVHYAFPVTVLPQSTELEAVCTIFETLNRTGKPLTPFELISARAFAGGRSLREMWERTRTVHPILDDFDIDPYYVLQVIALRVGASCQRRVVLGLSPDDIEREWEHACGDIAAVTTMLRDDCGVLVRKWLPYRPMLIPLAVAWQYVREADGPHAGARRGKLKRWFWCAAFTGEYESAAATLAERDSPILRDWLNDGAEPSVISEFSWDASRWRRVTPRQRGLYSATMALTLSAYPRDFHTGSPLTPSLVESNKVDDHHVFPRAFLRQLGRGDEPDSVINHCLIARETNARIGRQPPSVYLEEIREVLGDDLDEVLASHRLPTGAQSPLAMDDFDAFLEWRAEQLYDALVEACGQVSAVVEVPDPLRLRLDPRVEATELALRVLIERCLQGDVSQLPPHVAQKVNERVAREAKKLPEGSADHLKTLTRQLEFFDLRELEAVITSKQLWPLFEPTFRGKESLAGRFGQLAELRNALRHSRTLTEVAIKDGEAALAWFRDRLDAAPSDPD